jgi:hypothetical protein
MSSRSDGHTPELSKGRKKRLKRKAFLCWERTDRMRSERDERRARDRRGW